MSAVRRVEIPLLHDNHSHTSLYAALASLGDLSALDAGAALRLIRSLPSDRLTVLRGWRTNVLSLGPEALAELPPVLLVNSSLHGFLLSDAALPFVEAALPDLAEHRDDAAWREANIPRLFEAYCDLAGLNRSKLDAFLDTLPPLGFGSIEDLAVASARALAVVTENPRCAEAWAGAALYRSLDGEGRAACAGVKLFLDGAIGARTAAIETGWIGGSTPLMPYDDGALLAELDAAASLGAALAIHAIGPLAIEQALRCLERARGDGLDFPLVRLEHLQFISREQAFRARELGAILSMQPNFSSDTEDYRDRLEPALLARNNPFRMLIDEAGFVPGRDLIFGSDGMPHGFAHPARCSLFPSAPLQRLSLEELVAGYGTARGVAGSFVVEIDDGAGSVRVADAP
ncbi:MAG: amidohydrolase family protein [Spirochaetales bacterium]|nr:amidohydrolase family protein [Spirochaetales bacterium]